MKAKEHAEQIVKFAPYPSSLHTRSDVELARAYIDLDKRMQAAMEVIELARTYSGGHESDCDFLFDAKMICSCGHENIRNAIKKFESANG